MCGRERWSICTDGLSLCPHHNGQEASDAAAYAPALVAFTGKRQFGQVRVPAFLQRAQTLIAAHGVRSGVKGAECSSGSARVLHVMVGRGLESIQSGFKLLTRSVVRQLFDPPLKRVPTGLQHALPPGWPLPASTEVWVLPSSSGRAVIPREELEVCTSQLNRTRRPIKSIRRFRDPIDRQNKDCVKPI